MADPDDATKGILQVAPADVLRLALGADVRDVQERNSVRVSNQRLRDGLFEAVIDGAGAWAHLEVEANPRRRTPGRIAEYWHQLRFALTKQSVRIAVIYLERGGWSGPVPSSFGVRCPDGTWTRIGFHAVPVWELDAASFVRRGAPGLVPLVPFMRGSTPALVERALTRLRRIRAPLKTRAELQVSAAMFAGRVFPRVDWLGKLSEEVLMTSTTYDRIIKRGLRQGSEQGLEKGREQVLEEVRRGVVDLVREVHGRAPRGLSALLAKLHDPAALRGLLVAVTRAGSAAEALAAVERAARRRPRRSSPRRAPRG